MNVQADQNFCWVHMSKDMFSDIVAHSSLLCFEEVV